MKYLALISFTVTMICACSTKNQQAEQLPDETTDTSKLIATGNVVTSEKSDTKNYTLQDIQIGMRDEKVRALLGKPSKVDIISSELGEGMEDWWYGSNQKVRIKGGQVTRVVKDVRREQEILVKIKEAREQSNEAEVERLMDEIGVSN